MCNAWILSAQIVCPLLQHADRQAPFIQAACLVCSTATIFVYLLLINAGRALLNHHVISEPVVFWLLHPQVVCCCSSKQLLMHTLVPAMFLYVHMAADWVFVLAGSYGFVNFCHHAEAVNAIVTMNGQAVGDKALKCAWGRHQPRHAPMSALGLLQMQSQMQTQLGFLAPQGMLASMSPMLQMPAGMQLPSGMQMPNRLQLDGTSQLSQQAQQALQQHALLNPNMQLGPQPSATLTTQQQMLAARSLYGHGFNIYGSMYGAP